MTDAAHVWANVWPRGAVELSGFGVTEAKWLDAFRSMVEKRLCVVFERSGRVRAILGLHGHETWFQAVDGVEVRELTRWMLRELPRLGKRAGEGVTIHSLCVDPGASKWFALLGLKEDKTYRGPSYGGRVERRFTRD